MPSKQKDDIARSCKQRLVNQRPLSSSSNYDTEERQKNSWPTSEASESNKSSVPTCILVHNKDATRDGALAEGFRMMVETQARYQTTLVRNPYPVPDITPREGTWISRGPVLGEKVTLDDPRWYKRLEPHERLFAHHTLNSIRKDFRLVRSKQVPNDALDLALTSSYAHNVDMMVPKRYVCMQPETLKMETWRVLRNQIKVFTKLPPRMGDNLYFQGTKTTDEKNAGGGIKQRIHPSSLKLTIEGPHTDQTNPGFSRKIDGTLYSI